MEDLSRNKKWLSLKEASKLLGIHPVTLRIWSGTGKIPCTRTPGGHRRFAEEDILEFYKNEPGRAEVSDVEFKVGSALERAHWELSRQGIKAESWYESFDQTARSRKRELGQQLLTFLVLYATREEDGGAEDEILNEACQVGEQMGRHIADAGLSLAEVVRVFLMFESSAIDATVPSLARPGRIDEWDIRTHARAHSFMREILLTLIEAYQRGRIGAA